MKFLGKLEVSFQGFLQMGYSDTGKGVHIRSHKGCVVLRAPCWEPMRVQRPLIRECAVNSDEKPDIIPYEDYSLVEGS